MMKSIDFDKRIRPSRDLVVPHRQQREHELDDLDGTRRGYSN